MALQRGGPQICEDPHQIGLPGHLQQTVVERNVLQFDVYALTHKLARAYGLAAPVLPNAGT